MSLSYTNRYTIFKISWIILLTGIICDLDILKNYTFLFFILNISASSIALVLFITVFFFIVPLKEVKNIFKNRIDKTVILIFSLLLIEAYISSYFSEFRAYALSTTLLRYTIVFIAFLCVLTCSLYFNESKNFIIKSFLYFNFLIVISCVFDFYIPSFNKLLVVHFGHLESRHSFLRIGGIKYIRPSGFISDTNLTGFTITFSSLLVLLNSDKFKSKFFVYLFYALSGFSFGMLASRSALIAVIFSVIIFYIFKFVERKKIIIFLLVFFLVQLLTPQTQARIKQLFDKDYMEEEMAEGRIVIWKAAFKAFQSRPIIGLGTSCFFRKSRELITEVKQEEFAANEQTLNYTPPEDKLNPHCIFLVMLSEYGLIGFLIFIILIIYFTKYLIEERKYLSLIFFISLLFVSSLSNYAPYYKYYLLICITFFIASKQNMLIENKNVV